MLKGKLPQSQYADTGSERRSRDERMSSGGESKQRNGSLNYAKKQPRNQFEDSKVSTEDSYHYRVNPGIPKPSKKVR